MKKFDNRELQNASSPCNETKSLKGKIQICKILKRERKLPTEIGGEVSVKKEGIVFSLQRKLFKTKINKGVVETEIFLKTSCFNNSEMLL